MLCPSCHSQSEPKDVVQIRRGDYTSKFLKNCKRTRWGEGEGYELRHVGIKTQMYKCTDTNTDYKSGLVLTDAWQTVGSLTMTARSRFIRILFYNIPMFFKYNEPLDINWNRCNFEAASYGTQNVHVAANNYNVCGVMRRE